MRANTTVYSARLTRLKHLVASHGYGAAIIGSGVELTYLVGDPFASHERLTALVITPGQLTLIVPAVERGTLGTIGADSLPVDVHIWEDGTDAHQLVADLLPAGRIAVGATVTADHLIPIQQAAAGCTWGLAGPALAQMMMVKDQVEQEALRAAGAAIDRVHAQVPGFLAVGRTEAQVAADISAAILAEHDSVDFVIVGSGPNGANPHHEYSDRVLAAGDIVVVDIGGTKDGYHSDSTRTYVLGEPTPQQDAQIAALEAAQAAAVAAVAPGVRAGDIDAAARGHLAAVGLGELFIHRTGHGIGLSVHEEPFIVAGNELRVQPGMAFSVEPGIYVPGEFGARIEDIVLVTDDGVESVNQAPHGLVRVPIEN